jgi:hypothetical protein
VQVEHRAVAVGQAAGGLGDQLGEFVAGGEFLGAVLGAGVIGQVVAGRLALQALDAAQGFVAGDGVQPGP